MNEFCANPIKRSYVTIGFFSRTINIILKTIHAIFIIIIFSLSSCNNKQVVLIEKENGEQMTNNEEMKNPYYSKTDTAKLNVSDPEWKKILPDSLYYVAREKGTERAFTGKYWNTEGLGVYYCAVCGNALFRSDEKFGSSCGWPSFFETIRKNSVVYHPDSSHGMNRTEVLCGRCDSHLGHLFDDGPPPTGKRYCMNSIALDFDPDDSKKANQ